LRSALQIDAQKCLAIAASSVHAVAWLMPGRAYTYVRASRLTVAGSPATRSGLRVRPLQRRHWK
jgi:hypothetical protein